MEKINSGKLRAIGHGMRARISQVQLDSCDTLQYSGADSATPAQPGAIIATTSKRNQP
jgi:hypothetical protein